MLEKLNIFYKSFVEYFKTRDIFSKLIIAGLLIIGTFNLFDFFVSFGLLNLLIATLDLGVVYYGYSEYEKYKS